MRYRKHVRLRYFDYKSNGCYFVTICTSGKREFLANAKIKEIVVAELARLKDLKGVRVDYNVIMKDHLHMIVVMEDSEYALPEIIRRFKSKTTIFAKRSADQGQQLQKLWQTNYYEHIVRSEKSLQKIREYIQNNPLVEKLKWEEVESHG